jgi:4Fe-4S ferredoxin
MMEIEKEMEVEDSHIIAKQKTNERELILDYDYKRCAGCSICVDLCPKKALQEGPLQEIAKGLCGMCVNFCPLKAFQMTVKEKTSSPEAAKTAAAET